MPAFGVHSSQCPMSVKSESRSRVSFAPLPGVFVLQVWLHLVALSLACTQTLSHL